MTDATTAQAIASAPDPGAALREVIDAEVAAAVGRALGEVERRITEAEWDWGWHEQGPDPDGDEVIAGYGAHMAQMLYRLPVDGQTTDMRASIEQMLADLRALLDLARGGAE